MCADQDTTASTSTGKHVYGFDFMRLLAALMVVYSHGYPIYGYPDQQISGFTSIGGLGVYIFFSISGYLVTQSWISDPHPARFFARRALRIFPGLFVVVALTVLVLGPLLTTLPIQAYFEDNETWIYFRNAILWIHCPLPGMFAENNISTAVNGSLWSLPVEFLMYFMLTIISSLGILKERLLIFSYVLIVGAAGLFISKGDYTANIFLGIDLKQVLLTSPYFLAGSGLYLFRNTVMLNLTRCIFLMSAMLIAPPDTVAIVSWIAIPCIVIAFCTQSDPLFRIPRRVGDLSYGIYIYAFPVQQTIRYLGHDHLSVLQGIALAIPITASLAWLSWHLVEKRALRLKPKRRDPALHLATS